MSRNWSTWRCLPILARSLWVGSKKVHSVMRTSALTTSGWSKTRPARSQGSHHVRFEGVGGPLRLTTDIPLAYLDGRPFVLTGRRHFILTWDVSIDEPVPALCERFLNETVRYWREIGRAHV